MTTQGRVQPLLPQGLARERRLQVERTVDDTFAILALLSLLNESFVFSGMWEVLLIHFLRTVHEGHARLLDAERATQTQQVFQLLLTLLLCGLWNDGDIGHEQHLVVFRQLGTGKVSDDATLLQNARLLVQHGAQQVISVQQALHNNVDHALVH